MIPFLENKSGIQKVKVFPEPVGDIVMTSSPYGFIYLKFTGPHTKDCLNLSLYLILRWDGTWPSKVAAALTQVHIWEEGAEN